MSQTPPAAVIAAMILSAPAWARVGITVRDPRLRQRAADALARIIVDQPEDDPRQLPLPDLG